MMLAYGSPATEARPEGDVYALACNQKVVACMRVGSIKQSKIRTAVPLLLARSLTKGDRLYSGAKETVMSSGVSCYSVPSPVRAQKDFPLDTIFGYGKLDRARSAVCSGERLGSAVTECSTVLAAKTDVRLRRTVTAEGIGILGRSGTVEYKTRIPVLKEPTAIGEFSAPLDAISPVVPLLTGDVVLAGGPHGELFLSMKSSWVMFPTLPS